MFRKPSFFSVSILVQSAFPPRPGLEPKRDTAVPRVRIQNAVAMQAGVSPQSDLKCRIATGPQKKFTAAAVSIGRLACRAYSIWANPWKSIASK